MEVRFKNAQLEEAYRVAKQKGYKCYTSQRKVVTYFYFVNAENKIGVAKQRQDGCDGIFFSTVHVPSQKYGVGFSINGLNGFASPEDIDDTFKFIPTHCQVEAYKNWEEFASSGFINFFEI